MKNKKCVKHLEISNCEDYDPKAPNFCILCKKDFILFNLENTCK